MDEINLNQPLNNSPSNDDNDIQQHDQMSSRNEENNKVNENILLKTSEISTKKLSPDHYIKAQLLVSAGPRKNTDGKDTELGEDVIGALLLPHETYFWLLDGTSDSAALKSFNDGYLSEDAQSHVFSSRLLAQCFATYFQENIESYFNTNNNLEVLLSTAKRKLIEDWEVRLNNLSKTEHESIHEIIKNGLKPTCSTTIILGKLAFNGDLYALRTGDSKLFPFRKKSDQTFEIIDSFPFTKDPTDENDRIAFRLDYNDDEAKLFIRTNHQRCSSQKIDNVDCIMAFTDGIGRTVEYQLNSKMQGVVESTIKKIGQQIQKTYDDKSLIFLERVKLPIFNES